jgi:hypothetical protein
VVLAALIARSEPGGRCSSKVQRFDGKEKVDGDALSSAPSASTAELGSGADPERPRPASSIASRRPRFLALPRRAVGAYRGTGTPGGQRSCRIALASALLFPEPYW